MNVSRFCSVGYKLAKHRQKGGHVGANAMTGVIFIPKFAYRQQHAHVPAGMLIYILNELQIGPQNNVKFLE